MHWTYATFMHFLAGETTEKNHKPCTGFFGFLFLIPVPLLLPFSSQWLEKLSILSRNPNLPNQLVLDIAHLCSKREAKYLEFKVGLSLFYMSGLTRKPYICYCLVCIIYVGLAKMIENQVFAWLLEIGQTRLPLEGEKRPM